MIKYWPVYAAVAIFIAAAILILGPESAPADNSKPDRKSGLIEYRTTMPGSTSALHETFYWAEGGRLRFVKSEVISGSRLQRVGFILNRGAVYALNYDQSFAVKLGGGSDKLFAMRDANAAMITLMRKNAKTMGMDTVAGVNCDVVKTATTEACIVDDILLRGIVDMPGGKYVKIAVSAQMGKKIDPAVFAPPQGMSVIDQPNGVTRIDQPR